MAHFGQQQAFLQRKCLEAQTISMKPVEQSDLAIVRSVFQDSTAVKFFESGSTTVDADWIKGGKMFDRFQDWVRRSYNNELGWWIVYTKQFEVIGLIGLKHEKQTNSIEVSILFNEAFHHEQFVVEAICHLYWHYSQTLYLEESQVVLAVHVNNAFCQRCVSCFGLSLVSTSQHFFTYKGLVKNVMLQHNASVIDQVQGFLRQATSVASPAAASSSPLSSVARMARIDYNTSWKQKLISCNAKKVEFLNAAESQVPDEGEFLPCIDTNQLTTIGTVIVHKPLQGQMLTVSVAITSEDGSLILQANKSKRRKNSQHTTEKLESSTVTIDQDGCAEIRIQAANVLKSGTKRQKCYAVIELKRGAEILEQFSTEPFYIIAKLNYKNYEKTSVIAAPAKASVSSSSVSSANSAFTKQGQPCAKRARLAVKKEEVVKASSPVIAQQQAIDDDFLQLNQQEFMPSFMTPQAMNAPIVSNDFMQFNMNFAQPQQPPMYAIPQYAQPQAPLVHYAHHNQHHHQQQPMQFMDVLNNVYYEKQAMAQSLAPIVFEGNNANSSAGDFLDIELQSVNAGQNDAVCCAVEQQQNQPMSNAQIDQFLDMLANNPAPIVSNNNNGINSGDFIKEWNYGFF